ncbi:hypothetical protein V6N13_048937 [Hibiscus sabdariffa]
MSMEPNLLLYGMPCNQNNNVVAQHIHATQVPAPAPTPPGPPDVAKILGKARQYGIFIRLLKSTRVSYRLLGELNNTEDGKTIFAPTDKAFSSLKSGALHSLNDEQRVELVLYHVLPTYVPLSQFLIVSNPMKTEAGDSGDGEFPLNVTTAGKSVTLMTGLTKTNVAGTIYTDGQLAIYQVDQVLQPLQIFGANSPAPAPAPAPGKSLKAAENSEAMSIAMHNLALSACYCLEHRSYVKHQCPKADSNGVTVVICPLCAKGVRLVPDEDPNISWESHVNTECDPSSYENVTRKKKCPVPRCREVLTFSNTIKCRDCGIDHCLKHRFGLDHNCAGPKKTGAPTASSSNWATRFLNVASSFRENWQSRNDGTAVALQRSSSDGKVEECEQCRVKFSSAAALGEQVKKVHGKKNQSRVLKMSIDVCPKCSKGFRDPVTLVEHVERDHGGSSRA